MRGMTTLKSDTRTDDCVEIVELLRQHAVSDGICLMTQNLPALQISRKRNNQAHFLKFTSEVP
jgi:hypothetical protein